MSNFVVTRSLPIFQHHHGADDEDAMLGPSTGDTSDPLNMVRNHLRQQRRRFDGRRPNVRKTRRGQVHPKPNSPNNPNAANNPNKLNIPKPPSETNNGKGLVKTDLQTPSASPAQQPPESNERQPDGSMTINLDQDRKQVDSSISGFPDDPYPPNFDHPSNFESDLEGLYRTPDMPGMPDMHQDYEHAEFDDFVEGNDPLQNWDHMPQPPGHPPPFHHPRSNLFDDFDPEEEPPEEDLSLPVETETFPSTKTNRMVLVWSERKLQPLDGASVFEYFNCPQRRCIFTRDRRMQKGADALLLDYELLRQPEAPLPSRMAGQRWLLYAEQPPQPLAMPAAERLDRMQFDITWTYRTDADISLSRPFMTADQGRIPAPDSNSEAMRSLFANKRRRVLLIPVDHCMSRPSLTEKERENHKNVANQDPSLAGNGVVGADEQESISGINKFNMNSDFGQLLQPFLNTEIQQDGTKRLPQEALVSLPETTRTLIQALNEQIDMDLLVECDQDEQQVRSLLRQYMFALVLEEVSCANYRSPYVYWALEEHAVPILSNARNYRNRLPNGATVDLKSFQSAADLQQFIQLVSGDVRSYFKFLDWRRHLQVSYRRTDLCEMCERLHALPSAAETRQHQLAEKTLARKLAELKDAQSGNHFHQHNPLDLLNKLKNGPSAETQAMSKPDQTQPNVDQQSTVTETTVDNQASPETFPSKPIDTPSRPQHDQQQSHPTMTKRVSLSAWLQQTNCTRIDFALLLQKN